MLIHPSYGHHMLRIPVPAVSRVALISPARPIAAGPVCETSAGPSGRIT